MSDRLRHTIPGPRLAPYERAVDGTGVDALDLYLWNRRVSLALFDQIATLEVAMRSAMASELVRTFGLRWYENVELFDDDTESTIMQAWRQGGISSLRSENASDETVHGKLVASFMFGFWVKLLGKGEFSRRYAPLKRRRIYDTTLWKPCLRRAFPLVGDVERALVQSAAKQVQYVRNRIAHHEHVIWGVPIADRRDDSGSILRLDVSAARAEVVLLGGYISADLGGWLEDQPDVAERLAECPLPAEVASERLRLGPLATV
jgi:hypothetical protein